jgi:hypothetical protein
VIIPFILKNAGNTLFKNSNTLLIRVIKWILVVLCLIAPLSLYVSLNKQVKCKLLVHYYADKQDWKRVITESFKVGAYDVLVNVQYNRALYFNGTLLDRYFYYPQLMGSDGLIPDKKVVGEVTMICADLYYDLGYISEAIHWLYEAQMLSPYCPEILKKLIDCYIIAGKPLQATKYLDILDQNFMYSSWTTVKRKQIMEANSHPDAMRKSNMMPAERIALSDSKERLKLLLVEDSTNRMAYEYLQLYYLANNQLGDFYSNLKHLEDAGYKTMPRIFQEAIMLYAVKSGIFNNNLKELRVTNECFNDFAEFTKIRMQYKNDPIGAQGLLSRTYSHTYWYYILYDSPLITKAELKFREAER